MKSSGTRLLTPLLIVISGVVVILWVQRSATDSDPSASPLRHRTESKPVTSDAGLDRPSSPSPSPGKSGDPGDLAAFTRMRDGARRQALESVRRLLREGGGHAALERIRQAVFESTRSAQHRLLAAYLVRLIPFVAREDAGSEMGALALARDVLGDTTADSWSRFQAVAALGGVPSSETVVSAVEGLPTPLFRFLTSEEADFKRGDFDHSLVRQAQQDAASRPALLASLATDPADDVRALASRTLRLFPDEATLVALTRASLNDEYFETRVQGLKTLAALKAANFPKLVRTIIEKDQDPDVRLTAFRLLPEAAEYGPAVGRLLMESAAGGRLHSDGPAIADAAFQYLARGRVELQPTLVSMIVQGANHADLVRVYVERAGEAGLTEFLPVFQAIESSQPPSPAKDALQEGIRILRQAPHYQAVAERTKAATDVVRRLFDELNLDATPVSRKKTIEAEIDNLLKEIVALRTAAPR